jgi:hypothetical protein
MEKMIIYPQENNSIALVMTTGELPLEDVAQKDVPTGIPYLIVDSTTDLPENFDFFEAWEADFSNPDGYGIGCDAWFAANLPKESNITNITEENV